MTTTPYPKLKARKPVGGFIFLTVQQLCLLWWAYRTRLIQLMDFRVWFAAHEMVARRCKLEPDQVPAYTPKELHGLVGGVGGEHLRASLRRLEAVGLLTWSRTLLTFATSPSDLRGIHDLADFHSMLHAISNAQRRVPVPRQVVRLIAGGCRATVIATILGHMLRCLYYKDHRCISGGWCKASWIAAVFRMDQRNIKAARKHLVAIGWLQMLDIPQALCNRWGNYALISFSWARAAMEKETKDKEADTETPPSGSPPPPEFFTTGLPPLHKEHKKPLQDLKHQQPALQADTPPTLPLAQHTAPTSSGPTSGIKGQEKDKGKKTTPQAPTLRHIVLEDLRDTDRLLTLFEHAQTQGLIGKSDSERLTFLATAEHAWVIGSKNPCGLLAELIRRKLWHYVTESDEDAAYKRLKQHLYGQDHPHRSSPSPGTTEPPELSKDAAIVRYLQTQLARAGFHGDVFGLISRQDSLWTRERWDRAVLELEEAKRAWKHVNDLNRVGSITVLEECLASVVPSIEDDVD